MACRSRNADLVRILAVGRVSSRARRDRRWNWSQTHSTPWCTARIGARTRYVARTLPTRRSTPGSGGRSFEVPKPTMVVTEHQLVAVACGCGRVTLADVPD